VGKLSFPPEVRKQVDDLLAKYPDKRGALLPLLHLSQRIWKYVTPDVLALCAETVGASPADVLGTSTFYTMYHRKAPGRTHIRVCTTVPCQFKGGEAMLRKLEERLGIKAGQTTPDGRFSLEEVECLGSCDQAPLLMVNDDYIGPVDETMLEEIIRR
jgi:NADH-quinone oxidoreductase subunit E